MDLSKFTREELILAGVAVALAIFAAACVALKFILNVYFGLFGFGFWAAAVLAVVLVVFARRLGS